MKPAHKKKSSNWKLWLIFGVPTGTAVVMGILAARPPRPPVRGGVSAPAISANVPAAGSNAIPANFLSDDPADKAADLLGQGNDLLAAEKVAEAIEVYKRALALDPKSEDTHYNLGIALGRANQLDEAISHYHEALRLFPDYIEVRNNLGNLLMRKSQFAEAEEQFREAIRVEPQSESAHNNLGIALQRLGKITEAEEEFAKAAELKPDYLEAHFNRSQAQIALGRLDEAAAGFKRVLDLQPDFEPAMKGLARVQQLQHAPPLPRP